MSAFHKNGWITGKKRCAVYIRDNFTCACCNEQFTREKLTLDHIVPVSMGGTNHHTNLITMCRNCNSKKGARLLVDFITDSVQFHAIMAHVTHASLDLKYAEVWYNANKMPVPQMKRKVA